MNPRFLISLTITVAFSLVILAQTANAKPIPAPVTHLWIERKGHDLKGADGTIADAISAFVAQTTS